MLSPRNATVSLSRSRKSLARAADCGPTHCDKSKMKAATTERVFRRIEFPRVQGAWGTAPVIHISYKPRIPIILKKLFRTLHEPLADLPLLIERKRNS